MATETYECVAGGGGEGSDNSRDDGASGVHLAHRAGRARREHLGPLAAQHQVRQEEDVAPARNLDYGNNKKNARPPSGQVSQRALSLTARLASPDGEATHTTGTSRRRRRRRPWRL